MSGSRKRTFPSWIVVSGQMVNKRRWAVVPSLEHSELWKAVWLMGWGRPWELTDSSLWRSGVRYCPASLELPWSCYCSTTALLLVVLTAAAHTAPQWEWWSHGRGWVKKEEEMRRQSQEKSGAAEKHRGCKVQRRWKGGWKAEGSRAAVGRAGRQSGWRTWKLQGMALCFMQR